MMERLKNISLIFFICQTQKHYCYNKFLHLNIVHYIKQILTIKQQQSLLVSFNFHQQKNHPTTKMQSKKQILQKDLSFSNQIFIKNFNTQNLKSNHSSQNNISKNAIPPLVKYTDDFATHKQNNQNDNIIQPNNQYTQNKSFSLNPFLRTKNFGNNFNQTQNNQSQNDKIPPLSKLQQQILKKYRNGQNNNNNSSNTQNNLQNKEAKPTKVYLDKTDKLQQKGFASFQFGDNMLNIDSLEQSRIANDSIEKQNNWVLDNLDNSSSGFGEGITLLKNMEHNQQNKKKYQQIKKSPQNNKNSQKNSRKGSLKMKKINPLGLVANSLHTSTLPQFIDDQDDDPLAEQNNAQQTKNNPKLKNHSKDLYNNQAQIDSRKLRNRYKNKNILNFQDKNLQKVQNQQNKSPKNQKKMKNITLQLFNHYVQPFFSHQQRQTMLMNQKTRSIYQNMQKTSQINSILINEQQFDSNNKFDQITTKSSPIQHINYQKLPSSPLPKNKSISENIQMQNASTFSASKSITSNNQSTKQHFIHDKTSKQILGAILSDDKKLKMYLKYLQCQISNDNQNPKLKQIYEILGCSLLKIQQITHKSQSQNQSKTLAHSLINMFASRKSEGKLNQQKQIMKSFKPQIIRSNNKITIDFDPFLKYQRNMLNQRISYLKKCLQQKNKQTQLIKLSYDGIVHNYAQTLQNIAKKAEAQQKQKQLALNNDKIQKQLSIFSKSENKSILSQRQQGKQFLDVHQFDRGSLQELRFRKATFGKVPSSMRGSATLRDI